MEELSIEEKARRYDEAIVKGRQIQNTPYTAHWDTMKEVVEHLFPELAENEDERIRSSLIRLLQVGGYMSPEDKDKAFAWLAKQGEQKKTAMEAWKEMRLEAYAQAEKDLELTWQDIQRIVKIADQIVDEDEDGRLLTMSEEDYYKEVLARYMETNKE